MIDRNLMGRGWWVPLNVWKDREHQEGPRQHYIPNGGWRAVCGFDFSPSPYDGVMIKRRIRKCGNCLRITETP